MASRSTQKRTSISAPSASWASSSSKQRSSKFSRYCEMNFKKLEIKEQPEYIKHVTLMKYQLNGLK
jgi:hypothetical protein